MVQTIKTYSILIDRGYKMNIIHITQETLREKWIFEPCTAMEHQAMEKLISSMKEHYGV